MKIWHVIAAAGMLAGGFGVLLAVASQPPGIPGTMPTRHNVTQEMTKIARDMLKNPAPQIHGTDVDGKEVDLDKMLAKGPVFIYFVMDGCPCSIDVNPLFIRMHKLYGGKVQFLSVIDHGLKEAREWSLATQQTYPILPDPDLNVIHAYKAKASAFSCLVSQKGEIVKMWPGYSKTILHEMNEKIAAELKTKAPVFDVLYAPDKPTAGCTFGLPVGTP